MPRNDWLPVELSDTARSLFHALKRVTTASSLLRYRKPLKITVPSNVRIFPSLTFLFLRTNLTYRPIGLATLRVLTNVVARKAALPIQNISWKS